MGEVKLTGKPMHERIADHLKSSCSPEADVHTQQGTGPTRVHTALHFKGQGASAQRVDLEKGGIKAGLGNPGEGSIIGTKRGVV
jgi:hypothetical protein